MNILNTVFARAFADEWIAAWNARDVERVLEHYAEVCSLYSPFVVSIANEPSGRLVGKAALRDYWSNALRRIPDLHFELEDVLVGVNSLTLYYQGHRGRVAETVFFDEGLRVKTATACYTAGRLAR